MNNIRRVIMDDFIWPSLHNALWNDVKEQVSLEADRDNWNETHEILCGIVQADILVSINNTIENQINAA